MWFPVIGMTYTVIYFILSKIKNESNVFFQLQPSKKKKASRVVIQSACTHAVLKWWMSGVEV